MSSFDNLRNTPPSFLGLSPSGLVLCLVSCFCASGCYDSHLCGVPEICDYDDNDCDQAVDEVFVDEAGVYFTSEHCGGCGVSCAEVFPTAVETACVVDVGGVAGCQIVRCDEGFHLAGDGACVPDVPVLCLPCTSDLDCAVRAPGSECVQTEFGSRCFPNCGEGCPEGTECRSVDDGGDERQVCLPLGGDCSCAEASVGVEIGCLVEADETHSCAGAQVCEAQPFMGGSQYAFTECQPALIEACNAQDDDCDGGVDEDFRDEAGRYVARLHCGACASPCVEPGPNMLAECLPRGPGVECRVDCLEGFVNVDGIDANGCECERWDGMGPPPAVGVDSDCDGVVDDPDDYIYVTPMGSDRNPGTLIRPVRTIARALSLGRAERKEVLVSRGVYDGPFDLVAGVNIYGGYRADFRDRDLELYPVLVERRGAAPGTPVLTCAGITATTRVEGFTIAGSDATAAGEGSTAVYLNQCGPRVQLAFLTVVAGRAAIGERGNSSSDNLTSLGLMSLEQLNGENGRNGAAGSAPECDPDGGQGGRQSCGRVDVSGGGGGDGACPATGCTNGRACGNAGCTDFTSAGGVCDFPAVLRSAVANPSAGPGRGPGAGAAGEATYNAPTNRTACNFCDDNPTLPRSGQSGGDGNGGTDGSGGAGCNAPVSIDIASGRLGGSSGFAGTGGTNGSGGGGGSAGAGYAVIGGTDAGCDDRSGGAGGGGGSGGCGAPGAGGGTGGGTSTGIVVRLASGSSAGPVLTEVRVVTASGGDGGDGGNGAEGGAPGTGGLGGEALFWCSRVGGRGGEGGEGGSGGGAGGGCGGGSHGIVISGSASAAYEGALSAGSVIERTGIAGRGGQGGFSPGVSGSAGRDGQADPILTIP